MTSSVGHWGRIGHWPRLRPGPRGRRLLRHRRRSSREHAGTDGGFDRRIRRFCAGGRLLSDAAFAAEGIPRRVVCEVGDWELFLELVSAGVGIGFAPVGLQYPVLTAPSSVLRLIPVEGVRLERHIYLMLPSVGETNPAARRFANHLLRIRPARSDNRSDAPGRNPDDS
jgi:DNA-binding transcriptional LysR family regulator